jgi:hypothetical protein
VKKAKRRGDVKEGSPFEEESLLELIKEEGKLQAGDKDQVRALMSSLAYFGLVDESMLLHELVERVIKISLEADTGFRSVEQETLLERQPELKMIFEKELGRQAKDEKVRKELVEWANFKFFKH